MRVRCSAAAGIALAVACASAHGAAAHVHGKATLDVAVEAGVLTLEFSSPLDNLAGFEHAPRTEAQRAAVRRMAERLGKAETLFVPTPEARCSRDALVVHAPVLGGDLLSRAGGADRPNAAPAKDGTGHAELELTLVFRCAQPRSLAAVEVAVFDAFPQVKRIEARVAAGGRQAAATLTPRARRLRW